MKENISRMYQNEKAERHRRAISPEQLQQIEELASSIHYGSINLTFQDGVLVQIEKSEKFRISSKERN